MSQTKHFKMQVFTQVPNYFQTNLTYVNRLKRGSTRFAPRAVAMALVVIMSMAMAVSMIVIVTGLLVS